MPNVLIRAVPPEVHRRLLERAAAEGRSLQAFLQLELGQIARRESLDTVLKRAGSHAGGNIGFEEALAAIHSARNER